MNRITDDILFRVEKPARYVGGEMNEVIKDKEKIDIRFAFCFPDVYEVGMSHLGIKILYKVLNDREDTWCERVFAPWPDFEKQLRENDIPLYALESKDSISKFDFIGFTLQYEMSFTNILNMLDMANIPVRSSERVEDDTIVIMGGPCAYNPEPLYDIADIFNMGEGEEVLPEIMDVYKKCKGKSKNEFLHEAAKIEGVYVPAFYKTEYNEDNTIKSFTPTYDDIPSVIKKRIINDFDKVTYPENMIVPYTDIVHDRIVLETFRGCTRGCRFCQAGMIYRPVREKKRQTLVDAAEKIVNSTGYDDISLSSLSTCDYSDISKLVFDMVEKFKDKKVSVSLPSLRIDSFSVDLIKEIQKVRKTGLTFAPEAGSQRLRDVINKCVTEENLMDSVSSAFEAGWSKVKLYYILGLPYENDEDVLGIAELSKKVCYKYYDMPKEKRKKSLNVTVSTSIFVPKPFTVFQWSCQLKREDVQHRINIVRDNMRNKHISYNWHDYDTSYMEAVIARGDRRICDVIVRAFELGAKFDSWNEYFSIDTWKKAMDDCKVDGDFYALREKDYDEILPWDFVDVGVSKEFLISENEKAKKAEITTDCRNACRNCGINKSFKEGECFEGAVHC